MSYCPEHGNQMERCCEAGGNICYSCPAEDGEHWFYDGTGGFGLPGYHLVQTVEDCPVCQEEGSVGTERGKR